MTILFLALWLQMSAQPQIDPNYYWCEPSCIRQFSEAAQRAADETDGKPPITGTNNTPKGQLTKPEALEKVDVPAVQVKTSAKLTLAYAGNCVNGYGFEGEKWQCTGKLVWSCADKSRILEHDENSPPKYWCRKVQF